ncbi:hypothetical protein D3C73_1357370 [compost metagenome]
MLTVSCGGELELLTVSHGGGLELLTVSCGGELELLTVWHEGDQSSCNVIYKTGLRAHIGESVQ